MKKSTTAKSQIWGKVSLASIFMPVDCAGGPK